ncbi:MAG: ATP-binding protein [Isosphaeraceae bacterium]
MIDKVAFLNFKCLHDVRVDLERFTVFVGPNASGKSSILEGMHRLCVVFSNSPGDAGSKAATAVSRGSKEPVELSAEISGRWYRFRPSPSEGPAIPILTQHVVVLEDGEPKAAEPRAKVWEEWNFKRNGPSPLPLSVLLRLETSNLIRSKPTSDPTILMSDGKNLHSALASMALNDPDSWQRLQTDVRRIIPTIRRLRHTRKTNDPSLLFDTVGGDSLSAEEVSEGTLLVVGMLAALHASERPSLILLDDLDRGLHPRAQKELVALLRGMLDTHSDLQIVATTHSPYMLDCVDTREVRMTFLTDEGATVCEPLTSHPQYQKWKDEMTPGEMWSLFGERWLVEESAT